MTYRPTLYRSGTIYDCNSTLVNIFPIFKNPGSRATSVKAEPGSALESNLESNASISLSLQADKMVSPGGFIATSSRYVSRAVNFQNPNCPETGRFPSRTPDF